MLKTLLASLAILLFATSALAQPGTVLVLPFENRSAERNLDWLSEGLAELIIDRLQSEQEVYTFHRDERLAAFEILGIPESAVVSHATGMKLGWEIGADRVVTGRFIGSGGSLNIFARVINLVASSSSPEINITGKLEDVIPLMNTLSWNVLKNIVPGTRSPELNYASRSPIPRSAFENYVRGLLSTDSDRRAGFFEDAVRLHPQYFAALYQLGRLRHLEGDYAESTQRLERITAVSGVYRQAQFFLGLNHHRLGDYNRAAAVFSSLPPIYEVLVNLGSAHSGKPDTSSAVASWRRAAERDPFATEAPFNLGYLNFVRGETDSALRNLEQTLRLNGRDDEAMFLLSRTYARLGRSDDAQRMLAAATRIAPRIERWLTQPIPKLERVRVTVNVTALRYPETTGFWTSSRLSRRSKGQGATAWLEAIQTQVDSQLYGDARRELDRLLLVFPESPDAFLLLAKVHERQRSYDAAVLNYERAIALRPAAESYVMLAQFYRNQNQTAPALRAIDEALKIEPDHAAALAMKTELLRRPPPERLNRQ